MLWLNPGHSVQPASCSPVHLLYEEITYLLWELSLNSFCSRSIINCPNQKWLFFLNVFILADASVQSVAQMRYNLCHSKSGSRSHHTCVLQLSFLCSEWKAFWCSVVQRSSSIAPDLSCNLKHKGKIHHDSWVTKVSAVQVIHLP